MGRKLCCFFAWSLLGWLSINLCYSKEPGIHQVKAPEKLEPWFTGTLLAYASSVTPLGSYNIEPYLYIIVETGEYDENWHAHKTPTFIIYDNQNYIEIGLTSWMDITTLPELICQTTKGQSSFNVGDLPIFLGFQLLDQSNVSKIDVKLMVGEVFPIGKYQKLNPKKLATDSTGAGSFSTQIILAVGRVFEFNNNHFLTVHTNFIYSVSAPVHVKGFNTYGGGHGTRGKVYPGNTFIGLLAFEYNLTHNWALALDIYNEYDNKTRFRGRKGVTETGDPATSTKPSLDSFSLAPAIEYNFNENMGLIAGSWFTVKGRNTERFASAVVAFTYYW